MMAWIEQVCVPITATFAFSGSRIPYPGFPGPVRALNDVEGSSISRLRSQRALSGTVLMYQAQAGRSYLNNSVTGLQPGAVHELTSRHSTLAFDLNFFDAHCA